ncbi:MAG: baseplate J/gp47 family protein [Peptococcaceae bacterium]|nr:baseplate J/gp47 family protein [Peptococcaceae bacterium]
MLPFDNMDDELIKEIVIKAQKRINMFYPAWTGNALHEPGVSFVELFALLKELQQYQLEHISNQNRKEFLKLLGVAPERKKPAMSWVKVDGLQEALVLPQGTRLLADQVVFETVQREFLTEGRIIGGYFLGRNGDKAAFDIHMTEGGRKHFFLFGSQPSVGDSFYLRLDTALPPGEVLHIYFNIYENYPVKRNAPGDNFVSLAQIEWEYFSVDGWQKLNVIKDDTFQFIRDGRISFTFSQEMAMLYQPDGYLIRAVLLVSDYEVAPVLSGVSLAMIPVVQKRTMSLYRDYLWSEGVSVANGQSEKMFAWATDLALWGQGEVYLGWKGGDGLVSWEKAKEFRKETDHKEARFYLQPLERVSAGALPVVNQSPSLAADGENGFEELMVRLVCYEDSFSLDRMVGEGDGFPYQSFSLLVGDLLEADFQIMVKERSGYVQWDKVNSFALSGPESRHYVIDDNTGELVFGDCEEGMAPEGEVLIVSCSSCRGLDGNVKEERINAFDRNIIPARVSNPTIAAGGKHAETIDQAFFRLRKELRQVERAVTYEDYEYLVRTTPGLMVQNCKTIPVSKNPRRNGSLDENTVSIVVQPFSNGGKGKLSPAYIKNIHRHLMGRSLIGTKVSILAPVYIGIRLYAEILVKPYYPDAKKRIEQAAADYFAALSGEFGITVQGNDIYQMIDSLDCVIGINDLTISALGDGLKRNSNRDIVLPQKGVAYLMEADYTIIEVI